MNNVKSYSLIFRNVIVFFYLCCMVSVAHAKDTYIWSVVPQFTGIAVHRDWTPFLNAIEKDTGYHFSLKIYDSIPEFESGFADGKPDFAYMNPYHAVTAKNKQGYIPIIRDSKRRLTGILVTRKDSAIKSLEDLQGKRIAFPSPNAFAASLFPRALLTEKYNIQYKTVYANTHSNAFRFVLLNKAAASGGVYRTLKRERVEVQEQLRVIYETPSSASHPIVAHKRVPNKIVNAVQKAIIALAKTDAGKAILKAILIPKPIAANYTRDYKPLNDLNLEQYVVQSKK